MKRFLWYVFLVGAALANSARAGLPAAVVAVRDGDTLTVLAEDRRVTVDVADIEAPEGNDAFSTRSRQSLVELCEHRRAVLDEIEVGEAPRVSAYIRCGGVDVSIEQVRRGLARVIVTGLPPGSPLPQAQAEAQAAHRGIWAAGIAE